MMGGFHLNASIGSHENLIRPLCDQFSVVLHKFTHRRGTFSDVFLVAIPPFPSSAIRLIEREMAFRNFIHRTHPARREKKPPKLFTAHELWLESRRSPQTPPACRLS